MNDTDTCVDTSISMSWRPGGKPNAVDPDLTTVGPFADALSILKNVKQMPSCPQAATARLLHECSAIGSNINGGDSQLRSSSLIVDGSIAAYGCRLAVCELREARIDIPHACTAFMPTYRNTQKRALVGHVRSAGFGEPTEVYPDYEDIIQADLDECLTALEAKPQTWTSYSNAKQNAVFFCQATRSQVEKDENIDIYESLIRSAAGVAEQMRTSATEAEAMFTEVKTNFAQFQDDLYSNLAQREEEMQLLWKDLQQETRDDLAKILRDYREHMVELVKMGDDITETSLKAIQKSSTDLAVRFDEVSSTHEQSSFATVERIQLAAHQMLADMMQQYGQIEQGLQTQRQTLDSNNELLLQSALALANADDAARALEETLNTFGTSVKGIHNDTLHFLTSIETKAVSTQQHLDHIVVTVIDLVDGLDPFLTVFASGWSGLHRSAKDFAAFCGYTMVYSLLIFGPWQRWTANSLLGNVCAAFGTGLCRCPHAQW